jgi:hypothetical protein
MGVVGNLDQFARYQAAQAMEAAAQNPGGAGSVLGLGMGLGLAGQMTAAIQPTSAAGTVPPLPSAGPPPLPGKEWWVALAGERTGPLDLGSVASLAASGRVNATTLAWKEGQSGWQPAGALAELRPIFGAKSG